MVYRTIEIKGLRNMINSIIYEKGGAKYMAQYEIYTDATIDLPPEIVEDIGIKVIPMDFEMNGKAYSHYPDER